MAKSIISEGKTSTEAINKGLKELGCKKDDVEIKILEEDKKAFYSILDPHVVKVELKIKENKTTLHENIEKEEPTEEDIKKCENNLKLFLDDFCKLYGNTNYKITENNGELLVELNGEDASHLIGYRGDTINSLQNLLSVIGNKGTEIYVRVIVDIEKYRNKREENLKSLARKLEKTVIRTGKKVTLEPMTAYERKVIHTELQNSGKVTTYSVGEDPHRKIVVDLK